MAGPVAPLFHPRALRRFMAAWQAPPDFAERHQVVRSLHLAARKGALDAVSETSLHGNFLEVLTRSLGYTSFIDGGGTAWTIHAECPTGGGRADGALGFFVQGLPWRVLVPIELKGARTPLDRPDHGGRTPVQQARDYAWDCPLCRFYLVSNYRETRLYHKARGPREYELFRLEDLEEDEGFRRFLALLGRDSLLPQGEHAESALDRLFADSQAVEKEITDEFYAHYRDLRSDLVRALCDSEPDWSEQRAQVAAQRLLDRVLFIAFAEDRGLLPNGMLGLASKHRDRFQPRARWENLRVLFRWVDEGHGAENFPPLNGGLFRPDPDVDDLNLGDPIVERLGSLADYDFRDEVSVQILGHIFENSLESGSRRKEGVYYTPEFVTRYLARASLGRQIEESRRAWFERNPIPGRPAKRNAARITEWRKLAVAAWEGWRAELAGIRALDPACGSGAFLLAAFDVLEEAYAEVEEALAELRGDQLQRGLFDSGRSILLSNIHGVDLSPESVEITRLSLWLRTARRDRQLAMLDDRIRCGNSVVEDSEADARAFPWDAAWPEGFDVVLGNPPYVRHEELPAAWKEHWREQSAVFHGRADLYVYFFERALRLLRPGGRLAFIVTNKWFKAAYAEPLRRLLSAGAVVEEILDFGHAPIFPDADVFPCVVVLRKPREGDHPEEGSVGVSRVDREELGTVNLEERRQRGSWQVPQARLGEAVWNLEPPEVAGLMERMRTGHPALRAAYACEPAWGVKTGLNEAFLIGKATRDRLIAEHPSSGEIIKPYARGEDVRRWGFEGSGDFLIFARHGIDIEAYPAIKGHLGAFRSRLEPKPADWDEATQGEWPGRKPGTYRWFEVQDPVAWCDAFDRPKILYQDIQFHPRYALDRSGLYVNNTVFVLPSADPWLLAVLNSPLLWWYAWRTLLHGKDEALRTRADDLAAFPIAPAVGPLLEKATALVASLGERTSQQQRDCRELLDWLRVEHGIAKPGDRLESPAALDEDGFVHAVRARLPRSASRLSAAAQAALREEYRARVPEMRRRAALVLQDERELARLVFDAYGLSPEERDLVARTAPPRMPPML